MLHRTAAAALAVLLALGVSACAADESSSTPDDEPSTSELISESPSADEVVEPEYLPAGDLPDALTLDDVEGRTITAKPFADFAVGVGGGVWVSGVKPGVVRYDGASGRITARARIPGEVPQALESTDAEVLVPSLNPSMLHWVDAATGRVRARVELPASPLVESSLGTAGGTAYVLVEPSEPRLVAVKGERVVEEIEAPEGAVAVRAGYGWLWVVTSDNTVERYSIKDAEWADSIPTGPSPRFFDVALGAAWVMNQGDGSVTRVDAGSGEAETIPVTGEAIGGGDLTVGAGAVWLRSDSSVLRIDPRTRAVTHLLELPPGSGSVAAVPGSLWITNHDHLAVHRVPLPLPGRG